MPAALDCDARAWVRAWLDRQAAEPQAILTRGAGEVAAALAALVPRSVVLAHGDRDPSCPPDRSGRLIVEPDPQLFAARAARLLALGVDVFRADPPDALVPGAPAARAFATLVAWARRTAELEAMTQRQLGPLWLDNVAANLPLVVRGASVAGLAGRLAGTPIVVAGAGPSLATVFDELREWRDRFLLIAAGSAVRPLAQAGITADLVTVLEGRCSLHQFDGVPVESLRGAVLAVAASTHPDHLALPCSARLFFHSHASRWLAPATADGSILPCAGNVGTASLALAWLLGGVPVMAAGLDFARAAAGYYVAGAGSREEEHAGAETTAVEGWQGETLFATPELVSYREQTEDVLRAVHAREPRARFLALAAGGARIAGMQALAAARILPHLPRVAPGALAAALANAPRPEPSLARLGLERERLESLLARIERDPRGVAIALALAEPSDPFVDLLLGAAWRSAVESGNRSGRGCAGAGGRPRAPCGALRARRAAAGGERLRVREQASGSARPASGPSWPPRRRASTRRAGPTARRRPQAGRGSAAAPRTAGSASRRRRRRGGRGRR